MADHFFPGRTVVGLIVRRGVLYDTKILEMSREVKERRKLIGYGQTLIISILFVEFFAII